MEPFRILVTGPRDWRDYGAVARQLGIAFSNAFFAGRNEIVVVHGACRYEDPQNPGQYIGVDEYAQEFTNKCMGALNGITLRLEAHPAEWNKHGKAAGPLRNKHMVELGADACLYFDGPCTRPGCKIVRKHSSHGASGCAKLAEEAGIPVTTVKG